MREEEGKDCVDAVQTVTEGRLCDATDRVAHRARPDAEEGGRGAVGNRLSHCPRRSGAKGCSSLWSRVLAVDGEALGGGRWYRTLDSTTVRLIGQLRFPCEEGRSRRPNISVAR